MWPIIRHQAPRGLTAHTTAEGHRNRGRVRMYWTGALLAAAVLGLAVVQLAGIGAPGSVAAGATTPAPILLGVGCGSVNACQAVGLTSQGAIYGTTNAGRSWHLEAVPHGVLFSDKGVTRYVSCPSATRCLAVGYNTRGSVVIATTNSGRTWRVVLSSRSASLSAVSCGSSAQCIIAGSQAGRGLVLVSHNGGAVWRTVTPAALHSADAFALSSVSCGSADHCQVVKGAVIVGTTNGGRSWMRGSVPGALSNYGVGAVSCHTATHCMAIAGGVPGIIGLATTDAGRTWTIRHLPPTVNGYGAFSCGSATTCQGSFFGAGEIDLGTANQGVSWYTDHVPSGEYLIDVACVTARVCEAVGGGSALRTTNGGHTWSVRAVAK